MWRTNPQPSASSTRSVSRHQREAFGRSGYRMKTSVSAKRRWMPRKVTASGGPNAATYMWYRDIATATSVTPIASARQGGAVAWAPSETTAMAGWAKGPALESADFLVVLHRALVEGHADVHRHVLRGEPGD